MGTADVVVESVRAIPPFDVLELTLTRAMNESACAPVVPSPQDVYDDIHMCLTFDGEEQASGISDLGGEPLVDLDGWWARGYPGLVDERTRDLIKSFDPAQDIPCELP